VKLKKLLKEVPLEVYRGSREIEITGISENSQTIAPGNLFIAKKGSCENGSKYIDEAIQSGAVALLSNHGNPFLKVTQLIHPEIQEIEGKLASAFYGHPSKEPFVVGVTGTNGKTTIVYLLKHLFESFGISTGLIGTVEYVIGDKKCAAERTTPDVISNHKMLKEMVNVGCLAAVIEVSSHGLVQGRVNDIDFDVAIFTNLTHDHLDYHKTLEVYAEAKQLLFSSLSSEKTAVINRDSPWAKKMMERSPAQVFSYGFSPEADLFAHDIHLTYEGSSFNVTHGGCVTAFSWPLIGRHNVYNCLASLSTMIVRGFSLPELAKPISAFRTAPGRLERVGNSSVFVDYAHTPDALENVLMAMHEFKRARIITVFGCGGDRDQEKRPIMASIAERFSDLTIVTSDNPRSEDPKKIIEDMIKGFKTSRFIIESDRAEAIKRAISLSHKEDLILIAGKGHETYQVFSHQRITFDDRKVAEEALSVNDK